MSDKEAPSRALAFFSCAIPCLAALSQGVLLCWLNPVLPQMERGNGTGDFVKPLQGTDESLVASAHNAGGMVGAAVSGLLLILAKKIGLHRLLPLLALLSTASWLLIALVPKVASVVAGRSLAGFFVISLASISPNYISTVAPSPSSSATFLSLFNVARNLGMFLTVLLGAVMDWQLMTLVFGAIPPLAVVFALPFLLPSVPAEKKGGDKNEEVKSNFEIFKAVLRLVFIGTVYALSGIGPLTSFASKLIGPKYPYSYTIATTAFLTCNLLGSLVSAPLTRLMGQKVLLIVTSAILTVCTATMAAYYFFFPPIPSTVVVFDPETGALDGRLLPAHFQGGHMQPALPNADTALGRALFFVPIVIFVLFFFALGSGIGTHFTVFIGDLPQQGLKLTLPAVMVWLNFLNLLGNIVFTWLADQGKYTFMGMFVFHTVVNLVATTFFIFSRLKLVPPTATRLKSAAAAKGEKENVVALGGYLTVSVAADGMDERKMLWNQVLLELAPAEMQGFRSSVAAI